MNETENQEDKTLLEELKFFPEMMIILVLAINITALVLYFTPIDGAFFVENYKKIFPVFKWIVPIIGVILFVKLLRKAHP